MIFDKKIHKRLEITSPAFLDDDIRDEPFREQEYIPYLLRIQRVPERNQANMFYIELLPTIPDGREIRHRHTKVCCQIFIQVAMSNHERF